MTDVDAAAPATPTGTTSAPAGPATSWRSWRAWLPWGIGLLALIGAFVLQSQLYTGQERTATTIAMFVALATAWNLTGGYVGYTSFGQVGFFGLGGYTTAVLMTHGHLSFWLAMPAAGLLTGLFAAVIGAPLLRLKGHYFAVATLGVAEGLREVVTNTGALTGGGAGITIPTVDADAPTLWLGNDGFYVLFVLIAFVSVAAVGLLVRSRAGYALRAINQDEDAAAAMGVNVTVVKNIAFAVSAAMTGAVGSAYAFQQVTIFPERLFDVDITVLMVVMVVLGGAGTVLGPIIGAVAVAFVSEWLRQHYTEVHNFVLGAVIIIAVVLLPQGVTSYAKDAIRERRWSLLGNLRRYRL